jgi:hypothetical protein
MTEMEQKKLLDALRLLGAGNAAVETPPEIEAKILAAWHRPAKKRRHWLLPVAVAAVAASFTIGAYLMHRPAPMLPPTIAQAPFVVVPYVAPPAPYERTEIRRMNVPLAALMAAGIKVRQVTTGGTVVADVVVGQDGRPLAIRLI